MKIYFMDGQPVLWAGAASSFDVVLQAQSLAQDYMAREGKLELRNPTYDGSDGLPPMIEKRGNVGILYISGSLIDGQASWMRYFGVVGYDDITSAAARVYADPDIEKVLVRVESPGGMVSGIFDAGDRLAKLSSSKPTVVYSGSQAASGGYWLATSFKGDFVAGPTADIGSIGVVSVHVDTSKADEIRGIKKTILRSGDNKARVNSIEPLTPELKAKEEAKMADVHALFRARVKAARPNMSAEDLAAATDGSTFLGKRAVTAGLIDGVSSFEQALKLLDTKNPSGNTRNNSKGASMKLTEQQLAMLASGVPVSQLGLSAEDQAACQAEIDAALNANKAKVDDTAGAGGKADVVTPPATAPPAAEVTAQLEAATAQVTDLTGQVAKLTADLAAQTALAATAAPLQANVDALLGIARAATGKLQIVMGGSDTAGAMDVAAVVAEHTRLKTDFEKNFKIGGVAKQVTDTVTKPPVDPELERFRQRVAASRATKN